MEGSPCVVVSAREKSVFVHENALDINAKKHTFPSTLVYMCRVSCIVQNGRMTNIYTSLHSLYRINSHTGDYPCQKVKMPRETHHTG